MVRSVNILTVGSCSFPDFIFRSRGKLRPRRFPAKVALIEDDQQGWMLFDTGYSNHFIEVCRKWPNMLYKLTTPVSCKAHEQLDVQLENRGLSTADIAYVFLSHFHADHIAGCRSLQNARFVCSTDEYRMLEKRSHFKQVRSGYLKNLLPDDFESRCIQPPSNSLEDPQHPLLNSTCYYWIELPGHTSGHSGLLIKNDEQELLLTGDAFWLGAELQQTIQLTPVSQSIVASPNAYSETQEKIRRWLSGNRKRTVIASHDLQDQTTKIVFA